MLIVVAHIMSTRNIFLLIFTFCLVGCQQADLTGIWTVTDVNTDSFSPLSALPGSNWDYDRPKFDSTMLESATSTFYLAAEQQAKIEFQNDGTFNTTLFLANFGDRTFYYNLESSELVLSFSHNLDSSEFPQNLEVYKGDWKFVSTYQAKWELDNGKILTLKKE